MRYWIQLATEQFPLSGAGSDGGHERHRPHPDPGPDGPAAVVLMALVGCPRARHRVDPRRPRGHDRRLDRCTPDREGRARDLRRPARTRRHDLRARSRQRRALLGPPDGPLRAQEAVPDHPRCLPRRDGGHRVREQLPVLRDLPLLHRLRDRRGVRRHQLRHRRADPRARARNRGSRHQRQLLARRGVRRGDLAAPAEPRLPRRRPRLATHVRPRRGHGRCHPPGAAQRAGEPAMADHARPRGGGGTALSAQSRSTSRRPPAATSCPKPRTRSSSGRASRPASARSRGRCSASTRSARSSASR